MQKGPSFKNILKQLSSEFNLFTYSKGETVFKECDSFDGVYCIVKGKVKSTKNDNIILWMASVGDVVGIDAYACKIPYAYSIVAMENSKVVQVSGSEFDKLLSDNPYFKKEVFNSVNSRINFILWKMSGMRFNSTKDRLINYLKLSAQINPEKKLLYSLSDLAKIIDTTESYLIKVVKEYKDKNVLYSKNDVIYVADVKSLMAIK